MKHRGSGRHLAAWLVSVVLASAWAPLQAQDAAAARDASSTALRFDIPAQDLQRALLHFSTHSGWQVVFDSALADGLRSAPLRGEWTRTEALRQLLQGTGLTWRSIDARTVTLEPLPRDARTTVLAPVRVQGQAPADALQRVYGTAASVAVVTREDIERHPPRNTSDVLSATAGVFTSLERTDPGVAVNIRGMQDFGRVNVMLDGVRQNFQKSGHGSNGQVYLDPALLSGVDITKGPISTVGGAGAIAGMVNFRTLEVEDILDDGQRRGGRLTLSAGSNAYDFTGSLAGAQRFGERFEAIAAISRKDLGDFEAGSRNTPDAHDGSAFVYKNTLQEHWSGLLKGRWHPTAEHSLGLSYVGLDADFGERDYNRTNDNFYTVRSDTVKLDHRWLPADNEWIALGSSLYYTVTQRDEARRFFIDRNELDRDLHYETNTVGGTLENLSTLRWGDWRAQWTSGGEAFFDWTDPQAAGSREAELNQDFDPAWFAGSTPKGERLVTSAFSELALARGDWLEVTGGLRYDWYRLQGDGEFFVGTIRNPPGVRPPVTRINTRFEIDRNEGLLAPRLYAALRPWQPLQLFAGYGGGMRPPAITETLFSGAHVNNMWANYPGVNLQSERAFTWEIGANLAFDDLLLDGDALRIKAAWFDTRVEHYIVNAKVMGPTSTVDGGLFAPMAFVNLLNDVRFKGYELQLDYEAGRAFGKLAYTEVDADLGARRYDPFPLGSWVGYPDTSLGQGGGSLVDLFYSGPPERKLATSGGLRFMDRRVELGMRFRFEQPQPHASPLIGIVRIFDLWASWKPARALTLRLAVDNVQDTFVYELLGNGATTIGPGRTVIGSLTWSF